MTTTACRRACPRRRSTVGSTKRALEASTRCPTEEDRTPGLWLYGGGDTSIPVTRSIANLQQIQDSLKKDFTIIVFPNANHELVDGGAMCQSEGPRTGVMEAIFAWLLPRVGLPN